MIGAESFPSWSSQDSGLQPQVNVQVHLGYKDASFPQGQIAVSKLSVYPESYTEGTGIIDSMRSNRNKEDIVVSRVVITKVHCIYIYTDAYFRVEYEYKYSTYG